jgi:hypothetical protein
VCGGDRVREGARQSAARPRRGRWGSHATSHLPVLPPILSCAGRRQSVTLGDTAKDEGDGFWVWRWRRDGTTPRGRSASPCAVQTTERHAARDWFGLWLRLRGRTAGQADRLTSCEPGPARIEKTDRSPSRIYRASEKKRDGNCTDPSTSPHHHPMEE